MKAIEYTSRYYPSSKSWTHSPVWWFEIPLRKLSSAPSDSSVTLRCHSPQANSSDRVLRVPTAFLLQNQSELHIREDKQALSLFLSADENDRLTDQRGAGGIDFSGFEE